MIDTLFREPRWPDETDPDRTRLVLHLARQDMSDPSTDPGLLHASRLASAHDQTRCGLGTEPLAVMGAGELEYRVRPYAITSPPDARLCETCEASARVDYPDMLIGLSPFDGLVLAR